MLYTIARLVAAIHGERKAVHGTHMMQANALPCLQDVTVTSHIYVQLHTVVSSDGQRHVTALGQRCSIAVAIYLATQQIGGGSNVHRVDLTSYAIGKLDGSIAVNHGKILRTIRYGYCQLILVISMFFDVCIDVVRDSRSALAVTVGTTPSTSQTTRQTGSKIYPIISVLTLTIELRTIVLGIVNPCSPLLTLEVNCHGVLIIVATRRHGKAHTQSQCQIKILLHLLII